MITITVNDTELNFEHSLVSLSDWEAHYEKPFYFARKEEEEDKTQAEMLKYFEFMLINKEHRHLIQLMNPDQHLILANYMNKARTATTIREIQKTRGGSSENVTSELMYYWLVNFRIPFQPTEQWHLQRLLMLVKVCSVKQAPPPKGRQSRAKIAQSMREINEQRRNKLGTSG